MPLITNLGNLTLFFCYGDHGIPNFHVKGPGFAFKMPLDGGEILGRKGKIDEKAVKAARQYAADHQQDLIEGWNTYCEPIYRIED